MTRQSDRDRGQSDNDRPDYHRDTPTLDEFDGELDAIGRAFTLKDERRTGWQLRGIERPESVAAHSWGVAFLCLVFADRMAEEFAERGESLDVDRAIRLAIVHDLPEAETGDYPTRADPDAETIPPELKATREQAAIDRFAETLDRGQTIAEAWERYEARDDPAAVFVKEMDLIDMCLQALYYEADGRYDPEEFEGEAYERLEEFFVTARPRLRTGLGRSLFEEIYGRYRSLVDVDPVAADNQYDESDS